MKVGIITFHNASNYGAVLQTYALQEAVKQFADDVEVIDYDNRFIKQGLDVVRHGLSALGIYFLLNDVFHIKARKRKINRFRRFFDEYYNLSPCVSAKDLYDGKLKYDICLSGSDQIWNPKLSGKLDEIYFLAFANIKKKISYASSFGAYNFDDISDNEKIKAYLTQYEYVSVREKSEKLNNLLGYNALNHCDPTLLLSKEQWKNKLNITKGNTEYILVYCMTDAERIISKVSEIGRRLKKQVLVIGDNYCRNSNVLFCKDAGPKEFVEMFYNASFIVTNSFHGTAFAVNFGVPFYSIKNEKSPGRAMHFLESVGALDRMVSVEDFSSMELVFDKMEKYQPALEKLRWEAKKYIENCIMT